MGSALPLSSLIKKVFLRFTHKPIWWGHFLSWYFLFPNDSCLCQHRCTVMRDCSPTQATTTLRNPAVSQICKRSCQWVYWYCTATHGGAELGTQSSPECPAALYDLARLHVTWGRESNRVSKAQVEDSIYVPTGNVLLDVGWGFLSATGWGRSEHIAAGNLSPKLC